jgi:ring-1,2-phenylacetyl-CoA epoxidase subunit PaaC
LNKEDLFKYVLRLGDNSLILGQRLSEWCGHGPVLEEDIALTNIALDLIGQSRSFLDYAGKIEGEGRTEDDLAFKRDVLDFTNVILVERPNGHFGDTIARQFFMDNFNYFLYQHLVKSEDQQIRAIAMKSLKEVTYHARHSSEWVIRLGDGTEESHEKIQQSINDLWMFTGELFNADKIDKAAQEAGIGADLEIVKKQWYEKVGAVLKEATLDQPEDQWMQSGGKQGTHSEHLGFILAEMQYLPRAYPDAKW